MADVCFLCCDVDTWTGVSDSIVNQLLSKIDGVNSLNNILVIGMTNRKDMIDEVRNAIATGVRTSFHLLTPFYLYCCLTTQQAIIRPGRLEVHVEIGLPDEAGRLQIISIHTKSMRDHKRISTEALDNLNELARVTKNFSGAEIEGLVKSAASFAFQRNVNVKDVSKSKVMTKPGRWALP